MDDNVDQEHQGGVNTQEEINEIIMLERIRKCKEEGDTGITLLSIIKI